MEKYSRLMTLQTFRVFFLIFFLSSWKLRKRLVLLLKGTGALPDAHIPRALPEYAILLRSKTYNYWNE